MGDIETTDSTSHWEGGGREGGGAQLGYYNEQYG